MSNISVNANNVRQYSIIDLPSVYVGKKPFNYHHEDSATPCAHCIHVGKRLDHTVCVPHGNKLWYEFSPKKWSVGSCPFFNERRAYNVLNRVTLSICNGCLDNQGYSCTTPGCLFWLQKMPALPVTRNDLVTYYGAIIVPDLSVKLPQGVDTCYTPKAQGERNTVYLDGKLVGEGEIDPNKHQLRNIRPLKPVSVGYVVCPCGCTLQSMESVHEHWSKGHMDIPVYFTR